MNCLESQLLLQRWLDGESITRIDLDEHLAGCPECSALHLAGQRLQQGLRLLPPTLQSAGFRERLVARALADFRTRRRRRLLLAGTAAAAALVLMTLGGYYGLVRPWLVDFGVPASQQLVRNEPPVVVPQRESLRASVAEAGSAVVSLTRRQADETIGQTWRLLPAVTPPLLDDANILGEPLDSPARSLREASQNVSVGLEPVTTSARRAFDMFLREAPSAEPENRPGY